MKTTLLFAMVVLCSAMLQAQPTIDGQFVVLTNDGATYGVQIQVKADVAAGLGSTTLQFTFNTVDLSYPVSPVAGTDYSYQNFSGGSYVSTVTRPIANTVSVNISYNGSSGAGTLVNTSFTNVVTINFGTKNPTGNSNLLWALIEVFADDNITQWTNGSFSPVNTSPLPIQLSTFTAAFAGTNGIVLQWATLSEKDNFGFEAQRSLDANKNFVSIPGSFIKGNGTTVQQHSYSYTISNTDGKSWYYRLKQTDLDGTINYSEAIQAGAGSKPIPKEFALDQNYPNPFNPTTNVSFALPRDGNVSIEVYNILGQRVATLAEGFHQAGYYTVPFDARQLASGMYFYRMVTKETTFLKKMLMLR